MIPKAPKTFWLVVRAPSRGSDGRRRAAGASLVRLPPAVAIRRPHAGRAALIGRNQAGHRDCHAGVSFWTRVRDQQIASPKGFTTTRQKRIRLVLGAQIAMEQHDRIP